MNSSARAQKKSRSAEAERLVSAKSKLLDGIVDSQSENHRRHGPDGIIRGSGNCQRGQQRHSGQATGDIDRQTFRSLGQQLAGLPLLDRKSVV